MRPPIPGSTAWLPIGARGAACGGNQLGPMGDRGAWPVVRQLRLFHDHTGTGDEGVTKGARRRPATTGVFGLDARQWFQSFPAAAQSSSVCEIQDASTIERRGGGKLQAELAAMPVERTRRPTGLGDRRRDPRSVRSSESIDHNEAMASLGLDSLMALELRNRLEGSLGTTLPAALVWAYPTISDLAGALCERLGFEQTADLPEEETALADDEMQLLADLVAASEAEVAMGAGES